MEELLDLKKRMEDERPTPWEELPDLALYMDQIISYMPRQLIHFDEGEALTSAMVNNYIKDGLVPRAEGKRYGPVHLGYLTAVCALKKVLSVRDIGTLLAAAGPSWTLPYSPRPSTGMPSGRTWPGSRWIWPCGAMPASWPVPVSWMCSSLKKTPIKKEKNKRNCPEPLYPVFKGVLSYV